MKQIKQIHINNTEDTAIFPEGENYSINLIEHMTIEKIAIYGRPGIIFKFNLLNENNKDFILNNTGIFQMDTSHMPLTGLYIQTNSLEGMQQNLIIDLVYTSLEGGNN